MIAMPAPGTGRPVPQSELRRRRHAGLAPADYAGFSITREIADAVDDLCARVAASPRPARFRLPVSWLTEAIHEAAGTITRWDAEVDARAKTSHLADDPAARRWAMTTICDLAPRPAAVDVTDAMLADGSWAAAVIEMVEPVDAALTDLLDRAYPPGAPPLRGRPSRSDRLNTLLRESIDRAAGELRRRLDRADTEPSTPTAIADQARAELEAMGVQL